MSERAASRWGRSLLAILAFFALTVPLAWLWIEWGSVRYLNFLLLTLQAFHEAMGWAFTGKGAGGLSLRFVSLVPFLVLVLVTPGLTWRRRLLGALVGGGVIVASHLFVLTLANAAFLAGRGALGKIFPFILIMDGLPLLVWVVVARDFIGSVVPGLGEAPRGDGRRD